MEVLVTGAAGLLGSNVVTRAFDAGHHVTGTYHTNVPELPVPTRRLDIRDTDAFRSIAEELVPDMVVNCAAMTDVDDCEASPDRAEAINGRAPGELAATCAAAGITFVHVSSDYVFDGESESKYAEAAEPNPIQAYGRSKLLGEKRVRENHPTPPGRSSVVRVWDSRCLRRTPGVPSLGRLAARRRRGRPVVRRSTRYSLARGSSGEVDSRTRGRGRGRDVPRREPGLHLSPFEFGEAICRQIRADESLLTLATMDDVSRPAPRPTHTCLHVARLEERLGRPQPGLAADLDAIGDALTAGLG